MSPPGTPDPSHNIRKTSRRLVRGTVALCVLAATHFIPLAHAETSPRAAVHPTFARMVFDWPSSVQWSAVVMGDEMLVTFDKPISGEPKTLLKPLGQYIKSYTMAPDRMSVSFTLTGPTQLKTFNSGTSTVIDLLPAAKNGKEAEAPAATPPRPRLRLPPIRRQRQKRPNPPATSRCAAANITVLTVWSLIGQRT